MSEQQLTPEQMTAIQAHIEQKSAGICPMCQSTSWQMGPLVHAMVWSGGNLRFGSAVPLATIICNNCYFTAQFAAVPMGILKKGQKPSTQQEGSGQ